MACGSLAFWPRRSFSTMHTYLSPASCSIAVRQMGNSRLRQILVLATVPMAYLAEGWEAACISGLFLGVFYLFVCDRLTWIACRPLAFLGSISYALYLVHGSIRRGIGGLAKWLRTARLVFDHGTAGLSLGLAWILTEYFERPAMALLRG